jgi:protein disulfide-isomerase A1
LYKQFDEGKDVFTEKFDQDAIAQFAKTASIPLVGEVGPETYAGYMAAKIPLAYIFAETPEERAEYAALLRPVAQKHKGKVSFATIDAKQYGAHAGNLNLKTDVFPAFAVQDTVKNSKFPYDQEKAITLDSVHEFVQQFLDGAIEPSIKSEPIPETQEGPVQIVVAKNYNQIVLDDEKDVLIEFYAPWCGHCKALAPKYDELASLYTANKDWDKKVTIAKVDATANDVPDEISGFPTIKMYPAGGKDSPITYSGSRTVEDLVKFVAESGKYKVEASVNDTEMPDADPIESMGKVAEAATKSAGSAASEATKEVKSKVSEAAEAVKSAVSDEDVHDEL